MSIGPEHGSSRHRDPTTSKEAAARIRPGSQRFRLLVAHHDQPKGLTDEEAAEMAGLPLTSEYATRCSELRNEGFIEDTNLTRLGDAGTARMVRRITPWGRDALTYAQGDETFSEGSAGPLKPDWDDTGPEMPEPPEFIDAPVEQVYAECTTCGTRQAVSLLSSKYGPPQLVGDIKGKRLWEAKCLTCDKGSRRGLQSIWKETS